MLQYSTHLKRVAALPCEMTVVKNKDIFILKHYAFNFSSDKQMSFYDEMQVSIKTVRNVPFLHGHGHKVVKATGRSCHR